MKRHSRTPNLWGPCLLGLGSVIVAVAALLPAMPSHGRDKYAWRVASPWRVGAWANRLVTYDEPYPYIPGGPPGIVYSVRQEQFGPFVLQRSRPVSPRPGDYPEWDPVHAPTPAQ